MSEPSVTPPRRVPGPRSLRVGFLTVGSLLAVVLVAVSASSWLSAQALAEPVTRGQGGMILAEIGDFTHPGRGREPSSAELTAQIDALDPELGVRYVEAIYVDGQPGPRYGAPSRALEPGEFRTSVRAGLVREGELARMVVPIAGHGPPPEGLPPPPHLEDFDPDGLGPWGPGRDGSPRAGAGLGHPPPGGPRGHLVVEFEPILAAELEARALRELLVGIAGAVVVLAASLVFWRLAIRAERAEQRHAEQRQLAALGEMSAVLAHELRNPLASLKGHAQLLHERLDRDRQAGRAEARTADKAARVVAEAQRLEQLTHGLLAFVRLGKISPGPASPASLVEAAVVDLDRGRVDLELDRAPASWRLDAPRMQQVVANLVDNALQAAPDQRVTVTVDEVPAGLRVTVRDRGPGVPADQRARIFEPFVTTRTRGTGLGLAVSRRIVELHAGSVEVDDAPDGGARFRVIIPARVPEVSA